MTTVPMFDDVTVDLLPEGAAAYAGYIDGRWPNAAEIAARFPHAKVVRVAVSARDREGDCLDVEPGDATNAEAAEWFKGVEGRTATPKPWLYTSASNVAALVAVMSAAGISRDRYFIWAAHYTYNAHICGRSCGYPQADGTQWTDKALGRSLDESLISTYMLEKPTTVRPNFQHAASRMVTLNLQLEHMHTTLANLHNDLTAAAKANGPNTAAGKAARADLIAVAKAENLRGQLVNVSNSLSKSIAPFSK